MYGSVRRGISLLLMVLLAVTAVGAVTPREAKAAGSMGADGLPIAPVFGTDTFHFGGKAWQYLSVGGTEVFLLSKDVQGAASAFGVDSAYATSTVRSTMTTLYNTLFSSLEQSAIKATNLTDVSVADQKLFPLSATEAAASPFTDDASRIATDGSTARSWWLRSSADSTNPDTVSDAGVIASDVFTNSNYLRPALKLDREKLILAVNASESGAPAASSMVSGYTSYPSAKPVLLDTSLALTLDVPKSLWAGTNIVFGYSGATVGANNFIRVKLVDSTGAVKYTAVPVSNINSANAAGAIVLSGVAAGNYTAYVWLEQGNGANSANAGSTPISFEVEVEGASVDAEPPVLSSSTPAQGATNVATTTNTFALTFNEMVYATSAGTVTLSDGTNTYTAPATSASWNSAHTVATFSLSAFSPSLSTLAAGKTYTMTAVAGAFLDREGSANAALPFSFSTAAAPTITGPTAMSLTTGYTATNSSSAGTFTITGSPDPVVTKQSGDAKISWNTTTKQFDIAAGLAGGTYPVVIRATNSQGYDEHTFTLTVGVPANTAPSITGPTSMTLVVGYSATTSGTYTITGNPSVTTTKTSGNASITWDDTNKRFNIATGLAAGTYPVVVTATNGITPNATLTFTLTVQERDTTAPVIHDVTATPDSYNSARLYVYATDALPLTYQWQVYRNGTWQDISGATSAEYYYRGLNAYEEYAVRVIVRDSQGNESISYRVVFTLSEYNTISGLPESYTLYVDGSVTWSPMPTGGNWSYDSYYLTMNRSGNSVTFTARNEGSTTVTYTVGGVSYSVRVYINEDRIPQTGELLSPLPAVLVSLALLGLVAYMVYKKRRDA